MAKTGKVVNNTVEVFCENCGEYFNFNIKEIDDIEYFWECNCGHSHVIEFNDEMTTYANYSL